MKIHHKAFRARKWRPKSNAVASSQLSHMHVAWAVVNFIRFSNFYSVILVHTRKALGVWLLGWHMYLFCSLGYSWIRALTHSLHSAVSIYCWIIQKVTKQKKNGRSFIIFISFPFCCCAHAICWRAPRSAFSWLWSVLLRSHMRWEHGKSIGGKP